MLQTLRARLSESFPPPPHTSQVATFSGSEWEEPEFRPPIPIPGARLSERWRLFLSRRLGRRYQPRVSPILLPFLFAAGFGAGFVDAIAGGGGLITVPVLLATGLAPADALATNKLQATFGSGSAAWHYRKARLVSWQDAWPGVLATAAGATVGVIAVTALSPMLMRRVMPFLLAAAALIVWRRPALGKESRPARVPQKAFLVGAGLALGFYDGFFGPGTGTFWTLALVLILGFPLLQATAWTKWMNFTSNIVSLAAFAWAARMDWAAGLAMGAGQWLGARAGAGFALRGGAKVIRPVFLWVVVVATAKMFYDGWLR